MFPHNNCQSPWWRCRWSVCTPVGEERKSEVSHRPEHAGDHGWTWNWCSPVQVSAAGEEVGGKNRWRPELLGLVFGPGQVMSCDSLSHPPTFFPPDSLDHVLFFGCRFESKDFYFRSEWEEMMERGQLKLFTAFSRDQVEHTHTTVKLGVSNTNFLPISDMSILSKN